jgi:hypothetical protein
LPRLMPDSVLMWRKAKTENPTFNAWYWRDQRFWLGV